MYNRSILVGRLTNDPDLRFTPNGVAVANFTLAVERDRTNEDGTRSADFVPIVAWQKNAENVATYMTKGSPVLVEGRIQVRTYEKDGEKRWATEVVADRVKFLPDPRKNGNGSNSGGNQAQDTYQDTYNEMGFSPEDVPF